jgi:hypothetical protein
VSKYNIDVYAIEIVYVTSSVIKSTIFHLLPNFCVSVYKLNRLLQTLEEVQQCVPELNDTELCAFTESHQNQLGMLNCPECTPFGYEPKIDVSLECNVGDSQDTLTIESDNE